MGGYSVERSITVNAPARVVHRLVDDFHQWPRWSPWEDLDPDLQRTYSGADRVSAPSTSGRGTARPAAAGWRSPAPRPEGVDLTVEFLKPFRSTSQTRLSFEPTGAGTQVRWRMTGEQTGLMGVFGKLVSMDKLIGPDFEKGLTRLKTVAEKPR